MSPMRATARLCLLGVFAVALASVGAAVLTPGCANACSCGGPAGTPGQVAKQSLSGSSAVFSGEVVDIDWPLLPISSAAPETVTFRVSEVWKGPERRTLEVKTAVSDVSCGYPFDSGESYLVYAHDEGDGGAQASASLCSSTKPLADAGADLAALGPGSAPLGGPLPEGFGLVSALPFLDRAAWVTGAAALVAAVVAVRRRARGR